MDRKMYTQTCNKTNTPKCSLQNLSGGYMGVHGSAQDLVIDKCQYTDLGKDGKEDIRKRFIKVIAN